MAGTDITGLNNQLSRRNQDILKAIRNGVSDKRRALTSLRVNFNKSRTELAETKRSLNQMNIEQLNVKIADIADKLKQATGLLNQLKELNDTDDAVGILQRTIKLMSDEYKYASNRLKGGILDYNTVNRGIVDLANRIEPRAKTPGPVMVPTASINGPGIPLYNRDTSKSPRSVREPKVSINRVGNFVVTRLAAPVTPLSRTIPQRVPNFRVSQTAIRNESEHKEWQRSFFKQFEGTRDKKFQEVVKALKGLKFNNLPGPGDNSFDLPEIPDKPEGKDNKKPGSGGGDGKNRTTDRKSQGLRAGFAVGNNQRALAEASENFVDMDGNPIKDEYGNNPGLYVLKKGKELLESKVVEEGFQGLRNKARGLFGLAPDTPETATTVSPEASKPAAVIDNGKIQPQAAGAPLVTNTSMDVRESEVLLDEEWLKRLLQNLLGMNGGGNGRAGGGDNKGGASGNGGQPASLAPNSTGPQASNSGNDGGGTPGTGDDKGTKPAAPDSDKGDKPAPSVNAPNADNSPKQETPNPVVKPDAPKADSPSPATGGTTSGNDATSANPSNGNTDTPKASLPNSRPPVETPSPTPSSMPGNNATASPTPSTDSSPVPPAATPAPSGDTNKTTGDVSKDTEAPAFEMKMDEIEVAPPKVEKPKRRRTSENEDGSATASLASYNPDATSANQENKAKQAGVIDDDDDTPVAPVAQTDKQKAEFDYAADLTRKKEEAWQQYQRDAAPRDGEGLSDYMKRRDTMGLDNGGRKETDAQPGGYNALDKKQQLDESFEQYQKSDTWQGKYGSRIDSGQLVEDAKNRTGNRSPDEFTPSQPLSLDQIRQFRGPSLTPNTDTAGDSRVPFSPRMPKLAEESTPIEKSTVDTSSSMGNSSSSSDSTVNNSQNNSKNETPKSIIKTEGLGMVQIDGEYLT